MRSNIFFLCLSIAILSCQKKADDEQEENNGTNDINYRHEMRQLVINLSSYAKAFDNNFVVIPQNGQELATMNGEPDGTLMSDYLAAIDGQGREELLYGYDNNDDVLTPLVEREYWQPQLEMMRDEGIRILVTDYCSTPAFVD